MRKFCLLFGHILFCHLLPAQQIQLGIPTGHTNGITAIEFSPDGKLLATASTDNSVIIWNTNSWRQLRQLRFNSPVINVKFMSDSRTIVAVEGLPGGRASNSLTPNSFSIWNSYTGELKEILPIDGQHLFSISPDNSMFAIPAFSNTKSANATGPIDFFGNLFSKKLMALWNFEKKEIIDSSFGLAKLATFTQNRGKTYLLTSGTDIFCNGCSEILLWPINDKGQTQKSRASALRKFKSPTEVDLLVPSPSGEKFATDLGRNSLRLWNIDDGGFKDFTCKGSPIAIAFSSDGKAIFAASRINSQIFVTGWNVTSFEMVLSVAINNLGEYASIVTFSPNAEFLVIGTGKVGHAYTISGQHVADISGHIVPVNHYVFSSDGQGIITDQNGWILKSEKEMADREEILKGSFGVIDQISRSEESSPALGNSLKKKLSNDFSASDKNISKYRRWDLRQGGMSVLDSTSLIGFTNDSISGDSRFKVSGQYVATGSLKNAIQIADNSVKMISENTEEDKERLSQFSAFKKMFEGKFNDPNSPVNKDMSPLTYLVDVKKKDTTRLIAIGESDWIVVASNGYYMASKNAAKQLYYVVGNEVISFEQLDLKYNRPDKILEKFGVAEPQLIEAFRGAYQKRIRNLNIDTSFFTDDLSVPHVQISNKNEIDRVHTQSKISVTIKASEPKAKLTRFNVIVNDVPVFGKRGKDIGKKNRRTFDTTVVINLSAGENKIEAFVINSSGIESFRAPVYVNYSPPVPAVEKVYFVGIGIDKFRDSSRNLSFCHKDIFDLSVNLKKKYGDKMSTELLFDHDVTVENIRKIKQKLQQTTEDDKVIIAYSGHGLFNKTYDYYLSTYSINFDQPEQNGLSYNELEDLLDGIRSRKKLLMIDACHSGEIDKEEMQKIAVTKGELKKYNVTIGRGIKMPVSSKKLGNKNTFELMKELFADVARGTGATIIAASAGTQFALERGDLKNGVFTYSVLELLANKESATVNELKEYVGNRVAALTKGAQQPTTRSDVGSLNWGLWGSPISKSSASIRLNNLRSIKGAETSTNDTTKLSSNNNSVEISKSNTTTNASIGPQANSGKHKDIASAFTEALSNALMGGAIMSSSELSQVAFYPLTSNGIDMSPNKNPQVKIDSLEFKDQSAYTSGQYPKTAINCRWLAKMNVKNFKVNLSFRLDTVKVMPVLMVGNSCRLMGFYVTPEGKIRFVAENGSISQITNQLIKPGVWYSTTLVFNNSKAELFVNGNRIISQQVSVPSIPACESDKSISSVDFSNGRAFAGYWKNLEVFSGVSN